ncbi:hypothetical protein GCM10010521_24770 [Streptomyces rameus]|uniref:Uncharacterized protein n=1 Tax=Streptomyces rameus TaxID=68261 RepID=A0ABP6N8F8_9ACTN
MRTRVRLQRDGQDLVARFTPNQADIIHRVLTLLGSSDAANTSLTVQTGTDRETVTGLAARFAGEHARSFDMPLTVVELHTVHSALTAAPLLCLEGPHRMFSEQKFHELTGSFREHCDALAFSLVQETAGM